MKYVVFAFIVFMVGYAVVHRPRSAGESRQTSSRLSGRDVADLREELAAKEQLLATIKNAMATGNVPKCSRATDLKFSDEAYASVRKLEAEVAELREEVRKRGR